MFSYRVKQTTLLLTLLAFLASVLLPFFAVYNVPDAQAGETSTNVEEMASLFGEKVLICTADGFKWVAWEDLVSGKEKPNTHSELQCPLCYVATQGAKACISSLVTTVIYQDADEFYYATARDDKQYYFTQHSTLRPRAPPFSFIV